MEIITSQDHIATLAQNSLLGHYPALNTSKIVFRGFNNILWCDEGVTLSNSILDFKSDNALIVLRSNRNPYYLNISAWNDTVTYIGHDTFMNGKLNIVTSERESVIIGDDGLFSFGVWMRTADPHLMYNAHSLERINPSRSIFIGDHVWLGQDAKILKGCRIGSGSIIAASATVSGKCISSNSVWGVFLWFCQLALRKLFRKSWMTEGMTTRSHRLTLCRHIARFSMPSTALRRA